MKEKAVEGTRSRGGLNTRVYLEPIEKRFDQLPAAADIGVETITEFQNIIGPLLSESSKNNEMLTADERQYIRPPNTHVDFLIYNRLTKEAVLAIEVDGFHFHKPGTAQAERDKLKDSIFSKYKIPLLRLPTNGSSEIEKIREYIMMVSTPSTNIVRTESSSN